VAAKRRRHNDEFDNDVPKMMVKSEKKVRIDFDEDDIISDDIEERHRAKVAKENTFILLDDNNKPRVRPKDLSDTEIEMRKLKRRFKELRGYKPTGMNIDDLRDAIRRIEISMGIR